MVLAAVGNCRPGCDSAAAWGLGLGYPISGSEVGRERPGAVVRLGLTAWMRWWPEVVYDPTVACGRSSPAVKEIWWVVGVAEGWLKGLTAMLVQQTFMAKALL